MPARFDRILTTVHGIIYSSDTRPASLTADLCVAALDADDRNVFVAALCGILTDDAWDTALNRAVDVGHDPWTWTDRGRPTDTDYTWMICHFWAECWLATRRGKRVLQP